MIVFRPFKGEIITGQVQSCLPTGIQSKFEEERNKRERPSPTPSSLFLLLLTMHPLLQNTVTTQFFEDIFVPQTMLFEGCE